MSFPFQRVIVPFDFSPGAEQALAAACEITGNPACVTAVHVLPIQSAKEPGLLIGVLDNAKRRDAAKQQLEEKLTGGKYAAVQTAVAFGDPGESIVQLAEDLPADLIVVSARAKVSFVEKLLGRVSRRIIELAHCPVLVIKPAENMQ